LVRRVEFVKFWDRPRKDGKVAKGVETIADQPLGISDLLAKGGKLPQERIHLLGKHLAIGGKKRDRLRLGLWHR
jgi:hypothetical protein